MSMPEPKARSTARTDLLIVVPIAFALRLGFLIALARAIDMADSIHYINMGRSFAQGDFVHFDENLPVLRRWPNDDRVGAANQILAEFVGPNRSTSSISRRAEVLSMSCEENRPPRPKVTSLNFSRGRDATLVAARVVRLTASSIKSLIVRPVSEARR